ncbi:MAG: prepilin-type N-terminal cleavage/methylation domain-containing protein [Phycisphaeraceae bacterium]|nr:MAG: prepilin-type N-terminal cleavage/methylation domain-containing protein [Phycisphaeraceae bacterium]
MRNARRPCNAKTRGYTLIEVLIVVVVLGIAASLVTPSMGGSGSLRVQAAVRTIVADITFAQSDSLAFQAGRALIFNPDENEYTMVEVRSSTLDPEVDRVQLTSFNHGKFGDARITRVAFSGDAGNLLIFDEMGAPVTAPLGSTPASNGFVEVEGSGQRFTLTVEGFTGRVSVAREDLTPAP